MAVAEMQKLTQAQDLSRCIPQDKLVHVSRLLYHNQHLLVDEAILSLNNLRSLVSKVTKRIRTRSVCVRAKSTLVWLNTCWGPAGYGICKQ